MAAVTQYHIANLAQLNDWLVGRVGHKMLDHSKTAPLISAVYDRGNGLIAVTLISMCEDKTTGDVFQVEWAPEVPPPPFMAKLELAVANRAGRNKALVQVTRYLELAKAGASQEVTAMLASLSSDIRSIDTGL